MITPKFQGKVQGGHPLFNDEAAERYREYMRGLEGQEIEVLIRKATPWSSTRQKRFYHGVVIPVCLAALNLDLGDHAELDVHLRQRFLGPDENGNTRGLSSLTTIEFEDYLEQIRAAMASEHNAIIPRPNEASIYLE